MSDAINRVHFGDCRDTMRGMIDRGIKVQMCVTSPPYFGLRDYNCQGQIGLEATPAEYVATMVEVFGLVRELLNDDGVLWLNLGDTYATGTTANRQQSKNAGVGANRPEAQNSVSRVGNPPGCKTKDLIGIPWRVAFALQADGWYLRQDIIWEKPNPLPESVTDRCTKAHEYLFLLAKSERYYFDNKAISEAATSGPAGTVKKDQPRKMNATPLYQSNRGGHAQEPMKQGAMGIPEDGRRNRRSVWTIPTQQYSGAHFAVFPSALVEPCILAGSRPGDVVLDPFMGSGTTAQVAQALGRQWIGCELNPEYAPLQQERIAQTALAL